MVIESFTVMGKDHLNQLYVYVYDKAATSGEVVAIEGFVPNGERKICRNVIERVARAWLERGRLTSTSPEHPESPSAIYGGA